MLMAEVAEDITLLQTQLQMEVMVLQAVAEEVLELHQEELLYKDTLELDQ